MANYDQRKQTVYLPTDMLEAIRIEAKRLGRSVSWVLQRAWIIGRPRIAALPDLEPAEPLTPDEA